MKIAPGIPIESSAAYEPLPAGSKTSDTSGSAQHIREVQSQRIEGSSLRQIAETLTKCGETTFEGVLGLNKPI